MKGESEMPNFEWPVLGTPTGEPVERRMGVDEKGGYEKEVLGEQKQTPLHNFVVSSTWPISNT